MNTTISKVLKRTNRSIVQNSPTILTGLGVAGVISTTILAVRATPKALLLIEDKRAELYSETGEDVNLPPIEVIKATWKCYIPAVVMGAVTITAIISANRLSVRRQAALLSLFTAVQTAAQEYQEKVVQIIGSKKEELIRGEIAQDRLNKNPVEEGAIILTGDGETLVCDAFSGRYFKSDIESIRQKINDFNRELLIQESLTLNDLYDMFNLEPIEGGAWIGWKVSHGFVEPKFSAKLATNGKPALVLDFLPKLDNV